MIDINTYRQRIGYFNQKLKLGYSDNNRRKMEYFLTENKLLLILVIFTMFVVYTVKLAWDCQCLLKFDAEYIPLSHKTLENQVCAEYLPALSCLSIASLIWNLQSLECKHIVVKVSENQKLQVRAELGQAQYLQSALSPSFSAKKQRNQDYFAQKYHPNSQGKLSYVRLSQSPNFHARYTYGNKESKIASRGIKSLHLNVRSLKNKISDIKSIIKSHKPHLFGISECELKKNSYFNEDQLKIPGYDIIFPKSWMVAEYARVVLYVK